LSLADGGHPTDLGNLRASCRPCNALLAGQTGNRRERANRAGWRRNDSDPSPAFSGDGPPFSVLTPEERYAAGYCSRVW
jgi:hypothetical protein